MSGCDGSQPKDVGGSTAQGAEREPGPGARTRDGEPGAMSTNDDMPSSDTKSDDTVRTPGATTETRGAMDPPDLTLFPQLGATDFETAVAENDDRAGGISVGTGPVSAPPSASLPSGNAAQDGAHSGAIPPTTATPSTPTRAPSNDVMREIIEADVVQTRGDILYALNRYRGLLLVDMSTPDAPRVVGRAPFQAQPVDMYLRDDKAFVVMSDYFSYGQFDSDADPLGFHGSQLLVVDVSDVTHPAVEGSFRIDGEVTDTRIVGDVLYAVSKRNPEYWRYDTQDYHDTTWVLSIDLSDSAHIAVVDKQEFPGAANLIQVYETALSIAAVDPNYYLVDDDHERQTLITFVDISDPKGTVRVGGTAYVPGAVQDKFKMDLSGGKLRVISQDWYWQPSSAASLTIFDASDPAKLVQTAQIPVANAATQNVFANVQATRFAGDQLYVNLCWYDVTVNGGTQLCRVDFYDLSNGHASNVRSVAVDGPITYFDARGDRLLSLGLHSFIGQPSPVQIALFDVKELSNAQRISAVDLGGSANGSSSVALADYKAFKVFAELGMILLPLSWVDQSNGQYTTYQGAQIVDWANDALTVRGRVAQRGYVERAVAFRDRVVSISTDQIQVIDASDRDRPKVTANLYLVRNIVDTFRIGGYEVQLGVHEEDASYRFWVLPFGEDDMAKSVAELEVDSSLFYQMQDGDIVHLIGFDGTTGDQLIRNADFSDPLHPRWRGEYRVPAEIDHIYGGGYGGYWSFYDYFWSPNAGQPLDHKLLPVTTREVQADTAGRRFYKNQLRLIDLRDPDHPQLAAGSIDMPDWPFVNRVTHGQRLYSVHTEPALDKDGNPKKYHERYFLDRVDASDPNHLTLMPKVSIPGRLVDVDASGKLLYTIDYQWDEFGRRRNSFNVLSLDGDTATLVSVLPVGDEIDRARYIDREIWLTSHRYAWWGRSDDSPDSRQPYTRLVRLSFDTDGSVMSQDSHDVPGYDFELLDVEDTRIYLSSSYPTGLLILDTADFAHPKELGSARTVGYVSKLVRDADYLYMPMGSYGVRRVQAP